MADQKISQLNALLGTNTASGDLVTVVDISDTTMGATGTNKKMTLAEFQASPVSAGTANGVMFLNGTKVPTSGSALTFDGTNLGIGTTSPSQRLEISGDIQQQNANYLRGRLMAGTSTRLFGLNAADSLYIGGIDASQSETLFVRGATTQMTLNASGNLGLGMVPSAWESTCRMLQLGAVGTVGRANSGQTQLGFNYFINSSGQYVYIQSLHATRHEQIGGEHRWFTAASGTTGNVITFTQAMTLDASGNLGIGTTSPTRKLEVVGSAAALAMSVQTTGAGEVARFSDGTAQTLILGTTASGVYYNNANSGLHAWLIGGTERMRLDASGNLGLGVTPGVWGGGISVFQFGNGCSLYDIGGPVLAHNTRNDGADNRYLSSNFSTIYSQTSGQHRWFNAASGTAGNIISFTLAMMLDASGNLGLNTSNFGTSAAGVLSLGTGTAPTTGPADTVQLFSVDRSAGNTIPAVRCEGSGVTNAGITNTTVTNKIAISVNGTIYYLLATTNAT